MDLVSDAVFVVDAASAAILDANAQACRSLGYRRKELLTRTVLDVSSTITDLAAWNGFLTTLRAQGQVLLDTGQRRRDGSLLPVQINTRLVVVDGREYIVTVARDLSRILEQEAQLRLHAQALDAAANAIVITDTKPRILWANAAFTRLTGYSLAEAIGRKPAELVKSGKQDESFYRRMWDTILAGQVWHGELVNKRRDGSLYDEELTITPIRMEGGATVTHFIAVKQDISARRAVETELRHLATTDVLTGLANRRHFLDQVGLALARQQRHDTPSALLMLDLDWFKRVNDRYGHATGDIVLRHVATVMSASLRRVDLLGRLGGEEFAILLPDTEAAGAQEFAERLRQEVAAQPAVTPAGEISITVSIGVTSFVPQDGIDTLLARADRALYRAKANGRDRVELEEAP